MDNSYAGVLLLLAILTLLSPTMGDNEELQAVIQGSANFTKQLYNVLSRENGNVFFSPISAHAALAMSYQGTGGSTEKAFTNVLSVPNRNQAAEGYKDIMGHLNNLPDVQLSMANKIYLSKRYKLKSTFKEVVEKKFLSEVEVVNFTNSKESAASINDWVESKTQSKIKEIISPDSLDCLTALVLVNAIYFKGNWASKFDKSKTKTEKFYPSDSDSIDVPMMNTKGRYYYKEDTNLDAKVLELPYANPNVSLIVILPNKINGIGELETKLTSIDLSKITEDMFRPVVLVKLPKFKIESTIPLKNPLTELGLGVIFNPASANFSEVLEEEESLYVSKATQKAFIEVNEEGTEAAAATCIIKRVISKKRNSVESYEFYADHEFVFLLNYKKNIILFCGRLTCPK